MSWRDTYRNPHHDPPIKPDAARPIGRPAAAVPNEGTTRHATPATPPPPEQARAARPMSVTGETRGDSPTRGGGRGPPYGPYRSNTQAMKF